MGSLPRIAACRLLNMHEAHPRTFVHVTRTHTYTHVRALQRPRDFRRAIINANAVYYARCDGGGGGGGRKASASALWLSDWLVGARVHTHAHAARSVIRSHTHTHRRRTCTVGEQPSARVSVARFHFTTAAGSRQRTNVARRRRRQPRHALMRCEP